MTKKQIMYGAALQSEKMVAQIKGVTPIVEKEDKNTIRRWYTQKTINMIELDLNRNCLVLQMDVNANYNKTGEQIKNELLTFGDKYYNEYCR